MVSQDEGNPNTALPSHLDKQNLDHDEKTNYYDFQSFLNSMRNPKAEPIVKYTKSFIRNFLTQKFNWTTAEQEKLINDFKVFIYDKLTTNDVFKDLNETELQNAKEGIEKLVMSKLYTRCFSPLLMEDKRCLESTHEQDIIDDKKFKEKVLEYRFLAPEHLDILPSLINAKLINFIMLSGKELSKINNYRSPRDKIVCVLNSCKVLFGILKHNKKADGGADHFVPLLIFTLLKSDIDYLVSNVRYIERFRFPDFLTGESAYYLSTLQGAIKFILDMDKTSISVLESDEEFEEKYNTNQEEIKILKQQNQEKSEINVMAASKSEAPSTRVMSPSPSGLILKPLDDAANSVLSKINEFWSSTTSQESPTTPNSNGEERQEIDEHTATVLAQQMEQKEHENTLKTLQLMFPDLDPDLIQDVCIASKYRVGVCVDSLLELIG